MTKKIEKLMSKKGVKTSGAFHDGDVEADKTDTVASEAGNEREDQLKAEVAPKEEQGNGENEKQATEAPEKEADEQHEQRQKQLEDEIDTYAKGVLHAVSASIKNNQPLLLVGHTGTGKTTIIKAAAKVWEKELYRINLNGQTGREDLVGKYVLKDGNTEWVDGLLVTAMKHGHWILLDELNVALPEVQFVLQALIERNHTGELGSIVLTEKHGEKITPHPDFRLFATCNPPSYVGLKDMNTATLSRYIVATVEMMPVEYAQKHFGGLYPSMASAVPLLYKVVQAMLKQFLEGDVSYCASARDLDHVGAMMEGGLSLEDALQFGVHNKFIDPDEYKIAGDILHYHVTSYAKHREEAEKSAKAERDAQKKAHSVVASIRENPLMDDATFEATRKFFDQWTAARDKRKAAEKELASLTS